MILKLKPLERILKEGDFKKDNNGGFRDINSDAYICDEMFKYFDTEIDVKEVNDYLYNYRSSVWWWRREWFDFDFIKEEEFTL